MEEDPNLRYYLINDARRGPWGNLWFNLRRWPMNQLRFRQAVVMGADWRYIPRAAFPKGMTYPPVRYALFENAWLENKEAEDFIPAYKPQKVKQLFKEVEQEVEKPF